MTKVPVPPNCYGIEFPGGRKVDAKNGKVEIDDSRDMKWARKSKPGVLGVLGTGATDFRIGSSSRTCSDCTFEGWPWQTECPRCGGKMNPTEEEEE